MSCCSINNIARVVDVRQVLPVDSMKAKNEQFAQLSGFLSVPSPASQGYWSTCGKTLMAWRIIQSRSIS